MGKAAQQAWKGAGELSILLQLGHWFTEAPCNYNMYAVLDFENDDGDGYMPGFVSCYRTLPIVSDMGSTGV